MARRRKNGSSSLQGNEDRASSKLTDEQRHDVEREAYLRAERRNFQDGSPEDDWYAAEREVLARRD